MKQFSTIEIAVYDRLSHRHREKLADILCEGTTRPFDADMSKALQFYGLAADYPLMLDYMVHSLAEREFADTPKCSPFSSGPVVFWRKEERDGEGAAAGVSAEGEGR